MKDNTVDLIVTDPPYRVISGGKKPKEGFGYHVSVLKNNDGKIFKHNDIKASDYMSELYRVLKPNSDFYVMTNTLNLREIWEEAEKAGFKFHNLLVWEKNTATPNRWYMKNLEYTLYFYKGQAKAINNCGSKMIFKADNPRNKSHPTEKPISLFAHYIENSTQPGDIVLDPFMGSGACGVASALLGRRFVGIEIDETYFKVAEKRIGN